MIANIDYGLLCLRGRMFWNGFLSKKQRVPDVHSKTFSLGRSNILEHDLWLC
jgi:hypothetical protein